MKYDYRELITYMGMHKLPEGFVEAYELYEPDQEKYLIPRDSYEALLAPYEIPSEKKRYLDEALDAIEKDEKVLAFSRFFVWDMCSVRNKYDINLYTELIPNCLGKYNEAYAFLVLLACVPVAEKEMRLRGIPKEYYEDIPHRMLRDQMRRYIGTGKIDVEDMPWKMNFYTLTIFLLDRFLFIPYQFGDPFTMYRSKLTGKVIGLSDPDLVVDSEGQLVISKTEDQLQNLSKPHTGYEYARRNAQGTETFVTTLMETETEVTGYYLNPCGFVENRKVTLLKEEYEVVLKKEDWLIALHIPGGEGYTPERMRNSMKLALEFYHKYYPELDVKGFWSESWLYDKRLSFLIGRGKNITNVQEMLFCYSGGWDGEMLYVHLFREMEAKLEECICTTSLQKNAKKMLLKGGRFCSTGMIVLTEELKKETSYITEEDEKSFFELMKVNGIDGGMIC
ncbi:MAG: hypothetical protein IJY10_01185 [Lachnospiraceae bacterium]|nr:hypothetical protein [Lachnospiraceae bacterium]